MLQAYLLRFHRWLTLLFALPLLVVIGTGLVLSFEPAVQTAALKPGSITADSLRATLDRYDPDGKARGISYRAYENLLSISGVGEDGVDVDLATGEEADDAAFSWSEVFGTARHWHEHFLFDLGWLVTASTIAMLVIAAMGVAMGWPRLRMSVSGWHKGIAWFALPLVILSPLTGLALAFGITLGSGFGGDRPKPMPLREAVAVVGQGHDLSNLIWLRTRGGRLMARLNEGGELRAYLVKADGMQPAERNWPRLIHEGNWAGYWSAGINVVTSLALLGLLGTGLYLWISRKLRRRQPRARRADAGLPSEAM